MSVAADIVPLAQPVLGEAEEAAVIEVLRSGQLSLGPRIGAFEQAFAARLGVAHASAVSSGTAALHLGLRAIGVQAGDEVVTSPFSFVASANSILYEDARPVFADIDPRTLNLDPAAAAAAITDRTTALLPVHIFGYPADVPALEAHGLPIVEDACEALGAAHADGTAVGGRGHPAAFGFYANKQLTTGEGGMLTLGSAEHKAQVDSERNQGRAPDMGWLDHDRLGFNYRITDIQAAIGLVQLERLDGMLADRARVAACYREALAGIEGLGLPCEDAGGDVRGWFVFVVQLPRGAPRRREPPAGGRRAVQAVPAGDPPDELLPRALRPPAGRVPGLRGRRGALAGAAVLPGDDRGPGGPGRRGAQPGPAGLTPLAGLNGPQARSADRGGDPVRAGAPHVPLLEAVAGVQRPRAVVGQPGVERHAEQPGARRLRLRGAQQRARDPPPAPAGVDGERVDVPAARRRPRRQRAGRAHVARHPGPPPRRAAAHGQPDEAARRRVRPVGGGEAGQHADHAAVGLGHRARLVSQLAVWRGRRYSAPSSRRARRSPPA